ncbi:MAG: GatB/YqeY domain-containing protein [Pseudomonadota bacterium]
MTLRERINDALKTAMKQKDTVQLSTLRLINAAIKDRDIEARSTAEEGTSAVGDDEVQAILAKMVKQRRESAKVYEEGGRLELAEQELSEIGVIENFLPKQLDDSEIAKAVDKAVASTGAQSIRDMGRVMGALKADYAGRMDFGKVGGMVKDRLG